MDYEWLKIVPCPCLNILVPKLKCTASPMWREACVCIWRAACGTQRVARSVWREACVLSLADYLTLICSMGRFLAKFKSCPLVCPCRGANHDVSHLYTQLSFEEIMFLFFLSESFPYIFLNCRIIIDKDDFFTCTNPDNEVGHGKRKRRRKDRSNAYVPRAARHKYTRTHIHAHPNY